MVWKIALAAIFVLGGLAMFGAVIFAFVKVIKMLIGGKKNIVKLSETYPAQVSPEGTTFTGRSIMVGRIQYQRCAKVVISAQGLYIANSLGFGSPPFMVPWNNISYVAETKLYWQKAYRLSIGNPETGNVTLPQDIYNACAQYLHR
jgi:hypothetical protein